MKTEKIGRRDSEAVSVLYTQIQFTTDDTILKFCIKHLSLLIYEIVISQILFQLSFFLHTYAYELHNHEYSAICKCNNADPSTVLQEHNIL